MLRVVGQNLDWKRLRVPVLSRYGVRQARRITALVKELTQIRNAAFTAALARVLCPPAAVRCADDIVQLVKRQVRGADGLFRVVLHGIAPPRVEDGSAQTAIAQCVVQRLLLDNVTAEEKRQREEQVSR